MEQQKRVEDELGGERERERERVSLLVPNFCTHPHSPYVPVFLKTAVILMAVAS